MPKMIATTVPHEGFVGTLAYVAGYSGSALALAAANGLAGLRPFVDQPLPEWWDFEEGDRPRPMVRWCFPANLRLELAEECGRVALEITDHVQARHCALARHWCRATFRERGIDPEFVL